MESWAGEPSRVPVGALARAVGRDLNAPMVAGLALGAVIAIGSIPVAFAVTEGLAAVLRLFLVGVAGLAGFFVGIACAIVLPAFLLPSRSRRALAAFVWIGAIEMRRGLGSTARALSFPATPEAVPAWILANPENDANRPIHVEVRVMRGDYPGAREVLGRMPADTPAERFRRADLEGLVDYQEQGDTSFVAAREALSAIPRGPDRVEAEASFAVTQARLRSTTGDWREPLLAVRPSIPESDWVILVRDHGWPPLRYLLIRVWLPVAALIGVVWLVVVLGGRV